MAEDGGLHLADRELQLAVAGAVGLLEQGRAHGGMTSSSSVEGVNVALGDAAAQVAVDVLQVLRLGAVDVAREVEVVVVLRVGDFRDRHHAGVARIASSCRVKVSTIWWMSCSRRRFFGPSFMKPLEASIMKMPLRAVAFSLSSTTMQAGMPVP